MLAKCCVCVADDLFQSYYPGDFQVQSVAVPRTLRATLTGGTKLQKLYLFLDDIFQPSPMLFGVCVADDLFQSIPLESTVQSSPALVWRCRPFPIFRGLSPSSKNGKGSATPD